MKVSLPYVGYSVDDGGTASNQHFLMMTATITIPDGNQASMHAMVTAQKQIQEFVAAAEARLNDVDDMMLHDFVVEQLRDLATQYNQQLKLFTARYANH